LLMCGTGDMNYITHLEKIEKKHAEFIKTFTKNYLNDRLFYIVCIIAGFLVLAVVSIRHIALNYKSKVL
jgi:hypothetical protein